MTSSPPSSRQLFSSSTTRFLDASRALAALAVVLQHARLALLVDAGSVTRSNAAISLLYWASGFGHQAVMVFFVLSGALVGNGVLGAICDGAWSWRDYLVRRLTRLYIVLIPALVLVLVWDGLGRTLFPSLGIYGDVISAVTFGTRTFIVHNRSAAAYVGNAAFLMGIYVPVLGSNGALWSLCNEFWYYGLFPCVVLAVALRRSSLRSTGYLACILAITLLVGRDVIEWLSVWLLGVVAVRSPRMQLSVARGSWFVLAGALAFACVAVVERFVANAVSLPGDFAVGCGFAAVLYAVLCVDSSRAVAPDRAAASGGTWSRLAAFSYSLYLFHQPPLALVNAWLRYSRHSRWQPTALHVVAMFAAFLAVIAYSYAASRLTEAHTDDLRRAVARFFRNRSSRTEERVRTGLKVAETPAR